MSLLGTGHTPQAGSSAEAEALIAEARARARRRRRRIAVAVLGAVALAAGGLAATGALTAGRSAGSGTAGGAAVAAAEPAGPPAYFIDAISAGSAYSSPEIRSSATGAVVASTPIGRLGDYDPPYGLTATGPDSFVVGLMTPTDCSTQFFGFRINGRGQPGALTRVGPTLPGDLTAMAPSAGGGLIAFAVDGSGCANARNVGYFGVLNPVTGRIRQWTGLPAHSSGLSMSADGRLIAFTQELTKPAPGVVTGGNAGWEVTGYQIRVLATDAAPGSVEARSRVAATIPVQDSLFADPAVVLSRTGTSFYLCTQPWVFPKRGAKTTTSTATIATYRTATGTRTGTLASFAVTSPVSDNAVCTPPNYDSTPTLGCSSMALDPSGQFLLVPYEQTPANPYQPPPVGTVTAAKINVASGTKSTWTAPISGDNETMSIAW